MHTRAVGELYAHTCTVNQFSLQNKRLDEQLPL